MFLCDGTLSGHYDLYTEYTLKDGKRADIVAAREEGRDSDSGDLWIYVGEIKPNSVLYNGHKDEAIAQLNNYITAFHRDYPTAMVGHLYFWSPRSRRIHYAGQDYTLIVSRLKEEATAVEGWYKVTGLYTYEGVRELSKAPKAQKKIDKIEDQDPDELLPYNEWPDYLLMKE